MTKIVDRDCDKSKLKANREYIQPQWVFDSINAGILLPYHEYAHDAALPPHISPFSNDALKGYIPKQREHLDKLIAQDQTGKKPLKEEGDKDEVEGESKYIGEWAEDEEDVCFDCLHNCLYYCLIIIMLIGCYLFANEHAANLAGGSIRKGAGC